MNKMQVIDGAVWGGDNGKDVSKSSGDRVEIIRDWVKELRDKKR